jgi:hypothetical protein
MPRRRTRQRARFQREKDLESATSSDTTPEREEQVLNTEEISGDVLESNVIDSEAELEHELKKLEKERRELRKNYFKKKISFLRNDIKSMTNAAPTKSVCFKSGDCVGVSCEKRPLNMKDLRELESLNKDVHSRMEEELVFDDDDIDLFGREVEEETSRKGKRSGIYAKSSDVVKYPQYWPHCLLEFGFVSKSVEYKDLDFHTFVAGELEILTSGKLSQVDNNHRLQNLKQTVYLEGTYDWEAIRDMHAAKLRLIERGTMSWGSDFSKLESQILAPYIKVKRYGRLPQGKNKEKENDKTYFCKMYQTNSCDKSAPHSTVIKGKNRRVEHVCATCLFKEKEKRFHPETHEDCPYNNKK